MPTYDVRIVEQDGTLVRTLSKANVERVRVGMNDDVGEAVFTYPKTDPSGASGQAADVLLLDRECQIRKNGTVIHRGPMVSRSGGSGRGDMMVTSPGSAWYFGRRHIDAPLRNLLTDGDFEAGDLAAWDDTGVTATAVTSPVRRGTYAAQLVGTTTFAEQYIEQTVEVTGTGVGTELTLAAHFMITAWTGPAIYSRGLYVESRDTGVVETYNEHEGAIDDDTGEAQDVWQRAEATIWVPPNATRDIYVRLYAPNGTILWDSVELVEPVSLAIAPGTPEDIATTANRIVAFAQDVAYDKSDLDITTTTPPTTGITFEFPKAWHYADHTPVDRALNDEIVPLGVDWDVTPAKVFTVYHPRKGTDRTATVTLSLTTNVASYSLDEDGGATETDVTMLGEGDGPDREEGRSVDTTDTGGLVLQGVYAAPPGTTIDKLDSLAADKTARTARVVDVVNVVVYGSLVDTLELGDVVDVDITDGDAVALSGDWRIVTWELNARQNTLSLTLNREV